VRAHLVRLPLLWLPDAVAASAAIEHLGTGTPLDELRATGKLHRITGVEKRMSLGSRNHLSVSLAPPRLYFLRLKTPEAGNHSTNERPGSQALEWPQGLNTVSLQLAVRMTS